MAASPETRPVVLVLRGLGLGDLLTAVPALRALRRAWPRHRIVLAAPTALAELARMTGAIDEVVDVRGPGPVPDLGVLGVLGVDVAVNLHGAGPQSTTALARVAPGRLITHAHPALPYVTGPAWREDLHEVERWCALLEWYGIAADPADLALPAPPTEVAGHVIVHPGAAFPARRWPPERFAQVAAALAGDGHHVLVTGDAAERDLAFTVADLAGLPQEAVLAGRTGLERLAALVGAARLVVCGDTGVAHLATALATPSVVLFGPTPPARWGPPPHERRHVVLWRGRTGDPHAARPDPGLLAITPADVLAAVTTLERSPS
ncbi:glycosyltransferase family 9 protein [Streptosporangium saharense]|uniref:ADP-heptose:LPS heptosyltransferase n=1 Tax=Streptosporangium saharense TaxID=1706840 RepID=A0A7W7QPD2_9ACTN|nr:glycosyltransferase family 9 protein [Streptosporangium saharense]MBB4917240.1 ADP-heptose:LPS heptosyltransferase [Streptosporangium saharense]